MICNTIRTGALARCIGRRNAQILNVNRSTVAKSVVVNALRFINTTDKQKDHHHHSVEVYDPDWLNAKKPRGPKTPEEFADVESQKNWISYGFDKVDKDNDRLHFHSAMFSVVTCGFIVLSYCLIYFPDYQLHDWSLREAYLQLEHREKNGLPLINPDLVDPAKIELPSDEELGDFDIHL